MAVKWILLVSVLNNVNISLTPCQIHISCCVIYFIGTDKMAQIHCIKIKSKRADMSPEGIRALDTVDTVIGTWASSHSLKQLGRKLSG